MMGWLARDSKADGTALSTSLPLRLNGFTFTKPLLVCDTDHARESSHLQPLRQDISSLIAQAQKQHTIETASVYFRNLQTGEQFDINKDEKYFPASLRKIPLMIALLKSAEADPSILNSLEATITGADLNGQQEIKPREYAKIGKTYTVEDLIEKMIRFSDNNAAAALNSIIGIESLKKVFENLQIPFFVADTEVHASSDMDFITAYEFSFFLRVLYNATYLNQQFSEQALHLLSLGDFKEGLVAGVPPDTVVSHKFGLATFKNGEIVDERELHDCGIVYHPKGPYLLCIMTKSTAPVVDIENFIKGVSALVYQSVNEVDKS